MRPLQLLLLACASLAVSARNKHEIHLAFDHGCLQQCDGSFEELGSARGCIETVQRADGECENATLWITYFLDEGLVSCRSQSHGGLVKGVPTGDLVRELENLGYEWMYLVNVEFIYNQENPSMTSKSCGTLTLRGTGDMEDPCTSITQEPYEMVSVEGMTFWPNPPRSPFKLTDLALQADFGQSLPRSCLPSGNMTEVSLTFAVQKAIKPPPAMKDASIVFPDQLDCVPSGCNAIAGAEDVKICLDNARAEPSCKRAVYTRTYLNLRSDRCVRTTPQRLPLNMGSVLADDKALNFEDKHTFVTRVKFAHTPLAKKCDASALTLTESCSAAPSVKSILRENSEGSFTFTGDEEVISGVVATDYTLTTGCGLIENPDGGEVTLVTHFPISHPARHSASLGSKSSGSCGRIPLAGLLTTTATFLCIRSL